MKDKLLSSLKPLYTEMMASITIDEDVDLVPFCLQWGRSFPSEQNTGILFVGRATNGWVSSSRDPDVLFGDSEKKIFAREDQMRWVHLHEGNKHYNTRSSAFWRVIKGVTTAIYGAKDWYTKIAWSNLYKVSYGKGGNPDHQLIKDQYEICKKILQTEIEILSPRFVVFLTADWEEDFVFYLNGNKECDWIETHQWAGKNETNLCVINNTVIISSHHPQGKNEYNHIKTIVDIIKRY